MNRKWDRQVFRTLLLSAVAVAPAPLLAPASLLAQSAVSVDDTSGTSSSSVVGNSSPVGDSKDYYPAIDGASATTVKKRQETQPVFYAARRFSIPFSVAPTGRQPVEVQLLLSRDGGGKWQTYEKARPEARGFSFVAEEDGSFWFSLRTIDERGMAYPNQNEMLYVVIDTTKPDIGLTVDVDHNGDMLAQCTIAELWIDPSSVVLEYQTDSELKWNALPVEFKPGSLPGLFTGEKTWQPDTTARNLMVRLTAADRAGNKSEITRMYNVPRTASLGGLQLASQRQSPDQAAVSWPEQRQTPLQHTPGASPWQPGMTAKGIQEERLTQSRDGGRILPRTELNPGTKQLASGPQSSGLQSFGPQPVASSGAFAQGRSPTPDRSMAQWESTKPGSEPTTDRYANHGTLKLPATRSATPENLEPQAELARSDARPQGPGRLARSQQADGELRLSDSLPDEPTKLEGLAPPTVTMPETYSAVEELPAPEPLPSIGSDLEVQTQTSPAPVPPVPPAPKMLVETESPRKNSTQSASPSTPQIPMAPEEEGSDFSEPHAVPMGPTELNTYYSRSKAFSLDYDIDMTRGSQVSGIELWGTMDNGKTWSKWGEDEDRESPFDIRVDEEGMFGFRVVIVGSNLIASNQPRAGDPADAWIYVDTKAPDVKIVSAVYGAGEESGHLVIDYSCADDQLIDRPISISFSERRDGPWTTVASGLKNTGRYLWPAEPNLPKRIYLRIEAVDRAANIGVYRLDLPIDVEGLTPRGRIKGFRPLTD